MPFFHEKDTLTEACGFTKLDLDEVVRIVSSGSYWEKLRLLSIILGSALLNEIVLMRLSPLVVLLGSLVRYSIEKQVDGMIEGNMIRKSMFIEKLENLLLGLFQVAEVDENSLKGVLQVVVQELGQPGNFIIQ